MRTRIIAALAVVGTVMASSLGAAHAGVLFEVVKTVGKEAVHKAIERKQEREQRAYQQQRAYEQQRLRQQQRAQQQPTPQQRAQQQITPAQPVNQEPVQTPAGVAPTAPIAPEL